MQKKFTKGCAVLALILILCSCDYSSYVPSDDNTNSSSSEPSSSQISEESSSGPFIQSTSENLASLEPSSSSANLPSETSPQSESSESSKPMLSEESSAIEGSPIGGCWAPSEQGLLEVGGFFDIRLIRLIGSDEFEAWLREHPNSNVYNLIEDFGITDEQLKETLAEHVYEAYKEFWPKQ